MNDGALRSRDRALARAGELLAGFEPTSARALLHAACSSPTARHRRVGCSALLLSCWTHPPSGSKLATVADLPWLVAALRDSEPGLAADDDWVPLDPRRVVNFRRGGKDRVSWFRVHPGLLESPVEVLRHAVHYAEVLDPVLVKRLGFGIADVLEIAGRMLEEELTVLAPAWSDAEVTLDSVPFVTGAEVAAAAGYLRAWSLDHLLAGAREAEQSDVASRNPLMSAAAGLITPAEYLASGTGPDLPRLGPVLLVREAAGVLPVPAGLIIEGLSAVVGAALDLLPPGETSGSDGRSEARNERQQARTVSPISVEEKMQAASQWRERAWSDLEWICRGIPAHSLVGHGESSGHELLVVAPGHRHVVLIDLVTGLTALDVISEVRGAGERLAQFQPGSLFQVLHPPDGPDLARLRADRANARTSTGEDSAEVTWVAGLADAMPFAAPVLEGEPAALGADAEITRLIIVDGPWRQNPQWPGGIPVCTLDEFRALFSQPEPASSDREEVWAFLEELTGHDADHQSSAVGELICWSILDAWAAWRQNGMLFPAWTPDGTAVQVLPRDVGIVWERAAALDGADALLFSLGQPGVAVWPHITISSASESAAGSDGNPQIVTLSLYQPRITLLLCPELSLAVTVDLRFRDGLTYNRASAAGLAVTILDTIRELAQASPDGWEAWRQAHNSSPGGITFIPARLPEPLPAIRCTVVGDRYMHLLFDPARLAALDGPRVHELAGKALALGIMARLADEASHRNPDGLPLGDTHDTESGGSDVDRDAEPPVVTLKPSRQARNQVLAFCAAWNRIEPRIMQRTVATPFPPHSLDLPQRLTQGGEQRAQRSIARRLPGDLSPGDHPISALIQHVCPAALDALSDAARQFSARQALAAACAELERALSHRFTSRLSLEMSLEAPWADDVLADLDAEPHGEATRQSRIADLLTEFLLYQPPNGSVVPDRRDVHQLLDLAAANLEMSLRAQHAYAALMPSRTQITELGQILITATGPERVHLRAWQQAQLEYDAHAPASGEPTRAENHLHQEERHPGGHDGGDRPFRSLRAAIEEKAQASPGREAREAAAMLKVDDKLLAYSGFGLDSVLAVLTTAAGWTVPGEPYPPIARVNRTDLVTDVVAWSRLPSDEVEAAVDMCTLTASRIAEEGFKYWQTEHRGARLATRPLIKPPDPSSPDELWLLPRRTQMTRDILARYVDDCRLPWPDKDLPVPVQAAVKAWRQNADDALEDEVAQAARSAGLVYHANLTPGTAARAGIELAGEIDLLAADPQRQRIWVVEAKHLREPFSPLEIAFHVADFYGRGALALSPGTHEFRQFRSRKHRPYATRVLANVDAVRRNINGTLRLLGQHTAGTDNTRLAMADSSSGDWQVTGLFVTWHVEVAAFVPSPTIPTVAAQHLTDLFQTQTAPEPGWWAPWQQLVG